jgi:hypothetical protein
MGVGLGVGAFLSAGATGCIVHLLADIDERLEARDKNEARERQRLRQAEEDGTS